MVTRSESKVTRVDPLSDQELLQRLTLLVETRYTPVLVA